MSSAVATAATLYPSLPSAVELDADTKKRVIGGVKTALGRLQERGWFAAAIEYSGVLSQPMQLRDFLVACSAHIEVLADLAVDAKGRPVTDPEQPLSCKVTLAQIRQLLIHTCAKRLFTEGEGERKLNDLRAYLAFDWQLPLLKYYYFSLDRLHISELGRDLLLLRQPEQLDAVSKVDVRSIRQIRKMLGTDFPVMLTANSLALSGLAIAQPEVLPLMREALGGRVWDFYARDQEYIERMEQLDPVYIRVIGSLLADLQPDAVRYLQRLSVERLRTTLSVFRQVLGNDAEALLIDPSFAQRVLSPITQTFATLDVDNDKLVELLTLKFKSVGLAVRQAQGRVGQA
jgi:hypothetical protein